MICEIFKLIIGPVTGAALALFANRLFEIRNNKGRLVFDINLDRDIPFDQLEIKTNPSGYQLYCFNVWRLPVFISEIIFYIKNEKKDYFIQVFPSQENELSPVMPFTAATFSLNNQEFKSLRNFYSKTKKEKCKVIAYSVDNKKYKGEVNFWWMEAQCDEQNELSE